MAASPLYIALVQVTQKKTHFPPFFCCCGCVCVLQPLSSSGIGEPLLSGSCLITAYFVIVAQQFLSIPHYFTTHLSEMML
jgi:hypothetical protein